MTFKQRLPYFLVGLIIGIIVVIFVWGKKNTSFDYGPNARVLKNIRTKERVFSEDSKQMIANGQIDTAQISQILRNGKADMWNKLKIDDCIQYDIQGKSTLKNIVLSVKNCESTAYIVAISID